VLFSKGKKMKKGYDFSSNIGITLTNIGLIILAGIAIYITSSLWGMLILLFGSSYDKSTIETKCPKCDHNFTAVKKDDEEECANNWD